MGNFYVGTFMADQIQTLKDNQCAIINTDSSRKQGTHWVAIKRIGIKTYFFDSYNRPHKSLSTYFKNKRWVDIQHSHNFESSFGRDCGQLCLAFLLTEF